MTQVKALVDALDAFVVGCKADGTWSAIKASCIMAAWSNLNGALVPLAGTAPTRFGTEGGWNYNRKTGLQGNGTDNYLNSNRAGNADPQDNFHVFAWLPTQTLASDSLAKQLIGSIGNTWMGINTLDGAAGGNSRYFLRARQASSSTINFAVNNVIKPVGVSRSTSSSITARTDGTSVSISIASAAAGTPSFFVFAGNDGASAIQHFAARLAFYSIGESLDLALLDARVTTLINAISAAIP